jgi:hypothetical protein
MGPIRPKRCRPVVHELTAAAHRILPHRKLHQIPCYPDSPGRSFEQCLGEMPSGITPKARFLPTARTGCPAAGLRTPAHGDHPMRRSPTGGRAWSRPIPGRFPESQVTPVGAGAHGPRNRLNRAVSLPFFAQSAVLVHAEQTTPPQKSTMRRITAVLHLKLAAKLSPATVARAVGLSRVRAAPTPVRRGRGGVAAAAAGVARGRAGVVVAPTVAGIDTLRGARSWPDVRRAQMCGCRTSTSLTSWPLVVMRNAQRCRSSALRLTRHGIRRWRRRGEPLGSGAPGRERRQAMAAPRRRPGTGSLTPRSWPLPRQRPSC